MNNILIFSGIIVYSVLSFQIHYASLNYIILEKEKSTSKSHILHTWTCTVQVKIIFKMSLLFHIKQTFFKKLFWRHFLSIFDKNFHHQTENLKQFTCLFGWYYLFCVVSESVMQTQRKKNNVTILFSYIVKSDIKISIFSLNHSFSKNEFLDTCIQIINKTV